MTLNPVNEAPNSIWRGGEKQAALVFVGELVNYRPTFIFMG